VLQKDSAESAPSEFGDGQDFEHSKIIVFDHTGECDFGLDARLRGEMCEPSLGARAT